MAFDHEIDFAHDVTGREIRRSLGADFTLSHTWDAVGNLTDQSLTSGTRTVQHRAFTYRTDGNLVGIDDQLNGARSFELDDAGRVTTVQAHNWAETYAYDAAGNQISANWPARHAGVEARGSRAYNGNRIASAGRIRYEHDAQGRITLRQKAHLSRKPETWYFSWNAEDRLTAVTTPDGQFWRYLYDPLGRRIAKQQVADDGTVLEQVDFTWDGTNLAEQTTRSSRLTRAVTVTWEHNGQQPIAQCERKTAAADTSQREIDQRFFAIVTDLIGTPTELVDTAGDVAWRARATVWGTTTWTADSTAYTPLRFPGQYFDPETGLHYNFHRYYDPETARYASCDPIGLAAAPNPVAYVGNPHLWSDPLGLAPKCKPRPREGYTSAPFVEDDDYSPETVGKRSAANRAYYETPQDIHDLVDDILSNPNYPQRQTGPAHDRQDDFYGAWGGTRGTQRWRDSPIYDNGDPTSQARVIVHPQTGEMAYFGRKKKTGEHNYDQLIPYPWARRR